MLFYDILIYNPSFDKNLEHLEVVFEYLLQNQFHLKHSKCSIAQSFFAYLEHIASVNDVGADLEKVLAMLDWPTPTTIKHLCGFFGTNGFLHKVCEKLCYYCCTIDITLEERCIPLDP